MDYMSVSPQIHLLKFSPENDSIRRWVFGRLLGPEGRALWMRLVLL